VRTLNRFLEGLTLVAIGLILLGNTLGYLPWTLSTTFLSLISLWPVLLVTAGLDIIGRGLNAPWLRLLSSAIVFVAVLYGGLVLPASDARPHFFGIVGIDTGNSTPFSFSERVGWVDDATVVLKAGAGEITLGAGSRGTLVRMSGESPFDNPVLSVDRAGSTADVLASLGSGASVWPLTGTSRMNVTLSPAVTWDVQLQTGASTLKADLRYVPTRALLLKTGASDSDVTLGSVPSGTGDAPIRIESGVAAVTLRIPEAAEARVEAQAGLSTLDVPPDFVRLEGGGRAYESAGFESASNRYVIRVQTGIGSVAIRRY